VAFNARLSELGNWMISVRLFHCYDNLISIFVFSSLVRYRWESTVFWIADVLWICLADVPSTLTLV
jgi:hypothetical protein